MANRRDILKAFGAATATAGAAWWSSLARADQGGDPPLPDGSADAQPKTCPNPELGYSDQAYRDSLSYVDESPFGREKDCENCLSWLPASEGPCGSCVLMKGAVHVRGYCTAWDSV